MTSYFKKLCLVRFGKTLVTASPDEQPWRNVIQEGHEDCTSLPSQAHCAPRDCIRVSLGARGTSSGSQEGDAQCCKP